MIQRNFLKWRPNLKDCLFKCFLKILEPSKAPCLTLSHLGFLDQNSLKLVHTSSDYEAPILGTEVFTVWRGAKNAMSNITEFSYS